MKSPSTQIPFITHFSKPYETLWLEALEGHMPDYSFYGSDQLGEVDSDQVEVAVVANVQPEAILRYPNLKWVQSVWAGVDTLMPMIKQYDLKVVRMADPQVAESMSDSVLLWTLYLHQSGHRYLAQQMEAQWIQHVTQLPQSTSIGILGLGKLGTMCAARLKNNGFDVQGWSRSPKSLENIRTFDGAQGLDQLLSTSDILIVLLPLTDQTRHLLNQTNLAKLPPGASMMNFARGPIVHEPDLLNWLDQHEQNHAILDVFDSEPLPPSSPLWHHPQIKILPHVSAQTTPQTASKIIAESLNAYFKHGVIPKHIDMKRGY